MNDFFYGIVAAVLFFICGFLGWAAARNIKWKRRRNQRYRELLENFEENYHDIVVRLQKLEDK